MESTSHYHYPIVKALFNENFSIFVINPFLVKKFMDNNIRKGKTDKKDGVWNTADSITLKFIAVMQTKSR
ncbi:MAG: IS110 family transposase [Hungatella sp.]|nr:IS110 family transposase [Hungatella sp.]